MLVFDRELHGRDLIDLDKIAPNCKIGMKTTLLEQFKCARLNSDSTGRVAGSRNLSMRRTEIPNRFNSIAAIMPVLAPTIKTGFVVVILKLDTDISGQNVNNNVDVTIGKSAAKWKMGIITFIACFNSYLTV
jgi:hypothetical protein